MRFVVCVYLQCGRGAKSNQSWQLPCKHDAERRGFDQTIYPRIVRVSLRLNKQVPIALTACYVASMPAYNEFILPFQLAIGL